MFKLKIERKESTPLRRYFSYKQDETIYKIVKVSENRIWYSYISHHEIATGDMLLANFNNCIKEALYNYVNEDEVPERLKLVVA